jgi:hypothetical protein
MLLALAMPGALDGMRRLAPEGNLQDIGAPATPSNLPHLAKEAKIWAPTLGGKLCAVRKGFAILLDIKTHTCLVYA